MTVFLSSREIADIVEPELALAAARRAVQAESEGRTALPPRLDVNVDSGFLRVMPAAIDGVMGAKVMTLVRGVGNRYLLLLYSQESGALLAILDASEITRLRTAAVTVVAGEILRPERATRLAIIGSGFEAAGHLRAFAAAWPLAEARAFSPSAERCRAFAEQMSTELAIPVAAAGSAAAATAGAEVTVIATKSEVPVVDASLFAPRATVLSIGSTRPDLRELDSSVFARAALVLADSPEQVRAESGDVIEAIESGQIGDVPIVAMAEAAGGLRPKASAPGRDLLVFKSVGTALQDLALAREVVAAVTARGIGRDLGELAELKVAPNGATGVAMPTPRVRHAYATPVSVQQEREGK